MDIATLLPLINMLNQANNNQSVNAKPTEQPLVMSQADKDFVKKNTSMFPASFVPPKDFPRAQTSQQPQPADTLNQAEPVSVQPAPKQSTPNMDLNALLPLINNMAGNGVNTEQITKLMSGFNGSGDIGGLINLVSSISQNKLKNNKPKPNKQIINNRNQDIIFTD